VKRVLLALVYGVTTPLGIVIGIAVRSTYVATSPSGLLTQGILEAVSAGILIYTALVEFMTPQITHSTAFREQSTGRQAAQFGALYLGAALMAIIGLWA
jgi:zinc transporter 1/2/3